MAFEVELKARISEEDAKVLLKRIREVFPEVREAGISKDDLYFCSEDLPRLTQFRIRRGMGDPVVTRKRKSLRDGIEVNEEIEFSVSAAREFIRFAEDLGFTVSLQKQKRGIAFMTGNMTLEVVSVSSLGMFLEIEILLDTGDEAEVAQAREKLLLTLDRLQISRDSVEGRYYTEMLYESTGRPEPNEWIVP